jgi:tetratricopeptide (TPR) repeat protein
MNQIKVSKEKMGEIFRLRRKEMGLRQEDVAKKAGVSISTISNLELGNHTVKEESIIAYAGALGVAEDIFGLLSDAEQKEQKAKRELRKIEKIARANPDEALNQLTELNETFNLENSKTLLPLANYLWGKCYFEKRKWQQAEKFFKETVLLIEQQIDQNQELKQSNLLAACFNNLGNIAFYENNLKEAIELTEKGLASFIQSGKRDYLYYFLLYNKSLFLQNTNDLEKTNDALEHLQQEIHAIETEGNLLENVRLSVIIQYYDTYATVLNQMGFTEKALEYAQKGRRIAWLNHEYDALLTLWTTIGTIFSNKGDLTSAKECFLQALHIQPKIKREVLLSPVHIHLGKLWLEQNDASIASKHMKKALSISKKYKDALGQINAIQILGHCYLAEDHFEDAVKQFETGRSLAHQHGMYEQELALLDDLSSTYEKMGDRNKFLSCVEQSYRIRMKQKIGEGGT